MPQKIKDSNYAFIDSQNLNLGIKSQGWNLDFPKFRIYLQDKFHVNKAFLFIGYVAGKESLYTSLQESGYLVIFKPTLSTIHNGHSIIKGNVDAELVLHTMLEYNNYRRAVVVSGDGDFRCLIEHLVKSNKLERLIIPNRRSYSSLLLPFRDYMFFLGKDHGKKLGNSGK